MSASALHDYPASFPVARGMRRHFHFYLGPTNSGKTYEALQVLQQAVSGVYLAPLRLLAMEVRDRLMEAGVPCNLVTGEERHWVPGARHTACTVEMMRPDQVVDVAVIDEVQMLQDEARGYAWTAALVGVPAQQVFVCGSDAVTPICLALLESLNEPWQLTRLERKTPLILEEHAICGERYNRARLKGKLQKGDAVIAFTRKDVLTLSARIRQWGLSVASIYGALSPEVRRTESRRFASGEADVLVATDAIGMGLNLPIRRVVFTTVHKFDGVASRLIGPTETRQIAGRAGRYGIYPTGFVAAVEADELLHLQHMLTTSDSAELQQLPVAANWPDIARLSHRVHTVRIGELLERFSRQTMQSTLFHLASAEGQIALGHLIDQHAPHMPLADKFRFSCAPVSFDKRHEMDYFIQCLKAHADHKRRRLPEDIAWLDSSGPQYLEQAEQLSQDISLYAWLAFKYPQTFSDGELVPMLRQRVSRYIERALLTQAGYGDISRELYVYG
ncbi:helicase-related protein [Methylovorus menthalis]|uniref:helicase-related protein n=1 Tax=Methylovorus menthalis TaxID=1002227 RepID=UPI003899390E